LVLKQVKDRFVERKGRVNSSGGCSNAPPLFLFLGVDIQAGVCRLVSVRVTEDTTGNYSFETFGRGAVMPSPLFVLGVDRVRLQFVKGLLYCIVSGRKETS
jgi:hypothetical protein